MKIIHNENTENHLSIFKQQIKKSEKVFIAVAFFKKSGLDLIINEIEEALKRKTIITIVCGLDFYQTEPEALKTILALSKQYSNCKLLIHNHKKSITFHPKFFSFTTSKETHLIIGSANFTKGGLKSNIEVSLATNFENNSKQYKELSNLINSIKKQATELDNIEISNYTRKYQINKQNQKDAIKKSKEEENAVFNLNSELVEKFLAEYLSDIEVQSNYGLRKKNYFKAKKILEKIRTENMNENDFFSYYEILVGRAGEKSLWHSGSIYRGKNSVKKHHFKFKSLLNEVINNLNKDPENIYKQVEKYYKKNNPDKISGLGPNIITEILNTYSPQKFAILNQNPLTSIKHFGFEKFPHAQNFKSENYRDFNNLISGLMKICKFETLGQVDHFLNFIYWQVKNKK